MKFLDLLIDRPRVFALLLAFICLAGFLSLNTLPRQENPELAQRWSSVQSVYRGASPIRINTQVLDPLEAKLREVQEIKEIQSVASEGFASTVIELKDTVDPELIEQVWSEVQDKIDQAKFLLPAEVDPQLIRSSGPPTTLLYAINWNGEGETPIILLSRVAEDLKNRLAYSGATDKTFLYGAANEEVIISIDSQKLSLLDLTFTEIANILNSFDNKKPIGINTSGSSQILIKSQDNLESLDEIKQIPIKTISGSEIIRLGDIASSIRLLPQTPSEEIILHNGKRSVLVDIRGAFRQRMDSYASLIEDTVEDFRSIIPPEISIVKIYNESLFLENKFTDLSVSIFFATNIVILLSYLLLGLRSALIVGITLPLTIFLVLFGCKVIGLPLHQTSMTGIIIALGLLIDNSIIMVEDYKFRRKSGHPPRESAHLSLQHLWIPLAAATATTAFAFFPIVAGKGPSAEFVGGMGITVILSITASFFLALFVVPVFLNLIEKVSFFQGKDLFSEGYSNPDLTNAYRNFLQWSFSKPKRAILIAFILPGLGFLTFPFLKQDFFPELDRPMFKVLVELPENTSAEGSEQRLKELSKDINETLGLEVQDEVWFVGRKMPRVLYNVIGGDSPLGSNNVAEGFFMVKSYTAMMERIPSLGRELAKNNPDLKVITDKFDSGPPVFASIEYRILGDDIEILRELGQQFELILSDAPDVFLTKSDLSAITTNFEFSFNNENISLSPIDGSLILNELSISNEGRYVGTLIQGSKEIPIKILSNQSSNPIQGIEDLSFPGLAETQNISSFGDFKVTSRPNFINRFQGIKQNGVRAWIWPDKLASDTEKIIQEAVANFSNDLPEGYQLVLSGEADARSRSQSNLFSTAFLFIILIIVSLVAALNSFRQAGLILSVAILCVGLAFVGLTIGQANFGFIGLVGAVGLIGLSINDSIVVLSHIKEANQNNNLDLNGLVEVVIRSTRHVLTTTVTTLGGFLPLLITSIFFQPLAWAMSGGIFGATIIALLYIPGAYVASKGLHKAV